MLFEDLPELGLDLWFLGQTNFHFKPGELEIFITTLVLTLISVTRAMFEIRFSCSNLHRIPQVLDDRKTPLQGNRWLNWLWFISKRKTPWQRLEKKQKKEDVNKLVEYCHYTSVVDLAGKDLNSLRFDKWIGLRSLSLHRCKMSNDALDALFESLAGSSSLELLRITGLFKLNVSKLGQSLGLNMSLRDLK